MKYVSALIVSLCLVLAACSPTAPETDTVNYSEMIVGEWKQQLKETSGNVTVVLDSVTTYRSNGTEQSVGLVTFSDGGLSASMTINQTATWKITDDVLIDKIVNIDIGEPQGSKELFGAFGPFRDFLEQRIGTELKYTIKEISEDKRVMIYDDGNETILYRQ